MRAPVYRNIEAQNTFLGLAFPIEVLAFLGGCVAAIQLPGVPAGRYPRGAPEGSRAAAGQPPKGWRTTGIAIAPTEPVDAPA